MLSSSGILHRHKKNEILPLTTTRADLEDIMLSEMSEKNNYCMISLIQ